MATIIKNGKRWRAQVWREQISHFLTQADAKNGQKCSKNSSNQESIMKSLILHWMN